LKKEDGNGAEQQGAVRAQIDEEPPHEAVVIRLPENVLFVKFRASHV
jgi:hypothetical protein